MDLGTYLTATAIRMTPEWFQTYVVDAAPVSFYIMAFYAAIVGFFWLEIRSELNNDPFRRRRKRRARSQRHA